MNFNLTNSREYKLYGNITLELIKLYGIPCKYLKVKRLHENEVFGDFQRLKVNDEDTFEISVLPIETDNYGGDVSLDVFGLSNRESLTIIVSSYELQRIHPKIHKGEGNNYDFVLGNIVVFESGKIMEVCGFSPQVEGINNLFTFAEDKNVYRMNLKTYFGSEIQNLESSLEVFKELESIPELDSKKREKQNLEIKKTFKRKSDEDFNSVFGSLG